MILFIFGFIQKTNKTHNILKRSYPWVPTQDLSPTVGTVPLSAAKPLWRAGGKQLTHLDLSSVRLPLLGSS